MIDQVKFGHRVIGSIAVMAALAVGTVATSDAQTMQQQYGGSSQVRYAPPPQQLQQQNLPPAMRNSVGEAGIPCGGDFGMLGKLEEESNDVTEANPCNCAVCD